MKIKTSELQGAALDYAVAICEGLEVENIPYGRAADMWAVIDGTKRLYRPATDWAQGGPIVDREFIQTQWLVGAHQWTADKYKPGFIHFDGYGPTLLIAAMRCYVASKLGAEVEIPDELLTV